MTEPHDSAQQRHDDHVEPHPVADTTGSTPSAPTPAATGWAAAPASSPTDSAPEAADPAPSAPGFGPAPSASDSSGAASGTPGAFADPVAPTPSTGPVAWSAAPDQTTPRQGWSRDSATDPGTIDRSTWARYQAAGGPAAGDRGPLSGGHQQPNLPSSGNGPFGAPAFGGAQQAGQAQSGSTSRGGAPSGGSPAPGTPWNGWSPSASQQTRTFPAHTSDDYARALSGAPAQQTVTPTRRRRGRTVTAIVAATALALGAGFGGGVLATRVGSTAAPSQDNSLSPTPSSSEISNVIPGATGSVETVANTLLPSVVSILAVGREGSGEGSGVILTEDGLILTNNHVVSGAQQLTVRFNDGTTANATLVGATATDDLAVIQVEGVSGLTKATLGSSADLQVGQQVVAVGSPLGLSATVTTGIVSALNRPVRTGQTETDDTILNAVQTDAAINPGNSGGPLVDMNGHVIGINSAIATMSSDGSGQAGSIGVGFAIPIDQAYRIAQEIIDTGSASRAVLGASVSDAATNGAALSAGAELRQITSGGGAEAAGLQEGDIVTRIGDQVIESADALIAAVRSQQPGGTVSVTYVRGSQTETVDVNLGTATAD